MKGNHPVHQAQIVPLGCVRRYPSHSFSLTASPKLLELSVTPQAVKSPRRCPRVPCRMFGVAMPESPPRKLAAILQADVVGYSRLMEEDEAGTLARPH